MGVRGFYGRSLTTFQGETPLIEKVTRRFSSRVHCSSFHREPRLSGYARMKNPRAVQKLLQDQHPKVPIPLKHLLKKEMMKFTYVLPSNVARPRRGGRGLVLILL